MNDITMTWVEAQLYVDNANNLEDMANMLMLKRLKPTLHDFEYMRINGFKKQIMRKVEIGK